MGLFDIFSNLFSKSDKGKPSKKIAKKRAVPKRSAKKAKKQSGADLSFDTKAAKAKKRKKTKQVSADPINEQALGFSISLKGDAEQSKKRNAIRIRVDGLTVLVKRLKKQFPVTDISATGLGFAFEKPRVKGGVKLEMDLILNGEVKCKDLMCKVMRHERGSVGCIFLDLDRSQDDTVHEIVLLGQKQMAARKAAKKDRDFQLPS